MSKRTCKNKECKKKFEPIRANMWVCSFECSIEYSQQLRKKKEDKEWKERKKVLIEKTKTRSEHLKELQKIFNKYIRIRDKNKPCISCNRPLKSKYDAGHFRSVGGCPELRFNEDNVHGQCVYCNQHLHGNLIDYRINLIDRIGLHKVEYLERKHDPKKYTIPEIKELKEFYKKKIKNM